MNKPHAQRPTSDKNKNKNKITQIALNRKASHEYFLEEKLEAGVVLQGWEVKSLRAGKANISDAYVILREGEAWLFGSNITPLNAASSHVYTAPMRDRKLLLKSRELSKMIGNIQKKGYTCVPLSLYWKGSLVKCQIALAKGKQLHDKRQTEKEKDWQRDQRRIMKENLNN